MSAFVDYGISGWERFREFLASMVFCASAFIFSGWFSGAFGLVTEWDGDEEVMFWHLVTTTILFGFYLTWRLRDWIFDEDPVYGWNHHQFFFLWGVAWFLPIFILLIPWLFALSAIPATLIVKYLGSEVMFWHLISSGDSQGAGSSEFGFLVIVWSFCASLLIAFGDQIKNWSEPETQY